jgi:hypothetical protein
MKKDGLETGGADLFDYCLAATILEVLTTTLAPSRASVQAPAQPLWASTSLIIATG